MGFFDILNTFVGGTKAKASEVNTNFTDTSEMSKLLTNWLYPSQQFYLPFVLSAGSTSLSTDRIHFFKTFTMSGGTLNSSGTNKVLMIVVEGDCTITNGTIDIGGYSGGLGGAGSGAAGSGEDTPSGYTAETTGGGGGGIGGGVNSGGGGGGGASGSSTNGQDGTAGVGTPGAGGLKGVYTAFAGAELPDDLLNASNLFAGAGGGGGGQGFGVSGGNGGNGGAGGGSIIIICGGNLTFSGGTIDCSGTDGVDGITPIGTWPGGGGGGGGAGGDCVFLHNGTYTPGGTFIFDGGDGGAAGVGGGGAGNGGPGGNGGDGSLTVTQI